MPFTLASCILGKKHSKKKGADTAVSATIVDTSHKAPVMEAPKDVVPVPQPLVSAATRQLMDALTPLWNKRLQYKTFSGKAKVNYEGPGSSLDFTANFRVLKDSVIWVHITALGGLISAARIYVTRDSFFMLNYQQKEVTMIPLAQAAKVLPTSVEFSQLQNLVVGEPLKDGKIVNAATIPPTWAIEVEDSNYQQHITYAIPDSTMQQGQLRTRKEGGPKAMINYSNYQVITGRKISTTRAVHLENGTNVYNIDMNFVNAEFDQPLEVPFSVPKNYTLKNPQ